MRSRFSNSRKSTKGNLINVLSAVAIIFVLAVVGYLGYFYYQLENKNQINEDTLCPVDGAVAYLALVLDLTDPLNYQQTQRLNQEIKRLIAKQEIGTLISFGVVHVNENEQGARISICKPRTGENANALYENKALIEEKYLGQFQARLNQTIDSLMTAEEQPRSPIIESMTSLVANNPGMRQKNIPKNMVIVSDLIQNSTTLSFYQGEDWSDFSKTKEYANLSGILDDFDIKIIRIPRPINNRLDDEAIDDFWVRYFEAHRVRSISVDNSTLGKI